MLMQLILATIGRQTPVIGAKSGKNPHLPEKVSRSAHYGYALLPADQSPTKVGFVLAVALTNPQPRGTFKLASKDPKAAPIIDLNFLAVEEDRKRLLEGVKLSRRIASSDKLKRMIVQELNPWKADTDEQIIESMKNTLESYGHPFATALWGLMAAKWLWWIFKERCTKWRG